ncbi:hypothetical protein SAMN05216466_13246 [Paraburkholderia phenazinium]|uniref:alpha-L-fucosidase n=1 Tax=Paraburkholderia phenazinium TaxID=60549 RepID=A0A1G8N0D6_9BURK|nr:alpha-L-fucosidase [Paraburkholderia phenazinium]SDI73613.1 hypothetical protein SAMN05216466_13246 [Paraburkholderia phenazinium]
MSNAVYYFNQFLDKSGDFAESSNNAYQTVNYDGTSAASLSPTSDEAWLHFKVTIPAGNYTTCMIFTSCQQSGQKVTICLGRPDAAPLWTITSATTSQAEIFTDSMAPNILYQGEGEQDAYFCFPDGFEGALAWFVFCQNPELETDEARMRRMQWFNESRFGHMMHWGAYSVLASGEWVMNTEQIPKNTYIEEACIPFDPSAYSPESWADTIVDAGQRYLTITTKHHDGFAMFETNVKDFAPYDVVNTASIHKPVLADLAKACNERGIRFATYYSLLDWGNVHEVAVESAATADPDDPDPDAPDAEWYVSELKEHLRELIRIFDPVLIWFDGGWAAFMNDDLSDEIRWYLRRLSPDIIINNRLGGSPNAGDYTTPEQSIPPSAQSGPWECCMTINDSWGYTASDDNWKSSLELLQYLLDCASKGGNYLLNTGPTADGVIPQPSLDRLADLGEWLGKWGNAVYGTRAGTLDVSFQAGAYCTLKLPGTLYVTLTEWPQDKTLRVDLPVNVINQVYWLDNPGVAQAYTVVNGLIEVELPDQSWDPLGVVLVMEVRGFPEARTYPDKALFRKATASNVWNGNAQSYGPQLAVDGDSETRWATDDEAVLPITFELDLGREETFNRVAFLQYDSRIGKFSIEAYIDGAWQTLIEGDNPAVNYLGYLPEPVTVEQVRMTISSVPDPTNPPSLYSFSLFDANDTLWPVQAPVNVARGAKASASSTWYDNPTYQASMAIDGCSSTRWAAYDNAPVPIFHTIGFIKQETFDVVRITEYTDANGPRIASFTLQIMADDGQTWLDVYQGTDTSAAIVLPALTQSTGLRLRIDSLLHDDKGPSLFEIEVYQTARGPLPALSDRDLLEAEARLSFEYFWREANTTEGALGYGLVAKQKGSRSSSIACSGFALSALVIAAERGWVSHDDAEQRCQKSLQALWDNVPHFNGFYYHFIDMDTLDPGSSEVSTVDTMLALNGILTAGQYFGGQCGDLAQQIFDRVDWTSAVASDGNFTMSWDSTGQMSSSTWSGYTEQFCMYPMAAGSTTHAPADSAGMFYSLIRRPGTYDGGAEVIYAWGGALFTYQFSHAWLDFRNLKDRKGVDWWQNSVNATEANRQFCVDNSDVFSSMGENDWGLTACETPSGYVASGAPPSGYLNSDGESLNDRHVTDGTITPSGPLGSLPFTPERVLPAMRYWYHQHPRLWSGYGFLDSYNLSTAMPWYNPYNTGLIKGLTLLMIENYRSGLIWQTYMSHPVLQRGLPVIFD